MKYNKASQMFENAKHYCEKNYPDELKWADKINTKTFKNLKSKQFLAEYCWVVYASGFKVSTVESVFPDLKNAFKGFDIQTLSKMRSISPRCKYSIMRGKLVVF